MVDVAGAANGPIAPAADGDVPRLSAPKWAQRFRIPIALVALVAWLAITAFEPFGSHRSGGFMDELSGAVQWGIVFAGLFLLVLVAVCRWRDIGLNPPVSARSLLLLWLPAIYLLLFLLAFLGVDLVAGPPPLATAGFLLLNAALAGFSEEMMFRGVLFSALRSRLPFALAAAITTILFGSAHLLNVVALGNLELAATQAVAAMMSGLVFIAIRVRTGSLIPAVAYHALWDFAALVTIGTALGTGGANPAAAGNPQPLTLLVPLLVLLPNFLYALFLLRRRKPAAVPPYGEAAGAATLATPPTPLE